MTDDSLFNESISDIERGAPSVRIDGPLHTFREVMEYPRAAVQEVEIRFSDDGITIEGTDPANVLYYSVTARPELFWEYDFEGDAPLEIKIQLRSVMQSLENETADDDSRTVFVATRDTVSIVAERGSVPVRDRHDTLESGADRAGDVPDLESPWLVEIDSTDFVDIIWHLTNPTAVRHATFAEVEGHAVIVATVDESDDDNLQRTDVTFPTEQVFHIGDDKDEDAGARSSLSLDYLQMIAGGLDAVEPTDMELTFGSDQPLTIEFVRRSLDGNVIEGRYVLAPRMKE